MKDKNIKKGKSSGASEPSNVVPKGDFSLVPVLTAKGMALSKRGIFTFVAKHWGESKRSVARQIVEKYGVEVDKIRSTRLLKKPGSQSRYKRPLRKKKYKKFYVTLKGGAVIDDFKEDKSKKSKKK